MELQNQVENQDNTSLVEAAKLFAEDKETSTPPKVDAVIENTNTEAKVDNIKVKPTDEAEKAIDKKVDAPTAEKEDNGVKKGWREHFQETDEYKEIKRKEDESKMLSQMEAYSKWENSEIGKLWLKAEKEQKSMFDVVKEFNFNDVAKLSEEEKFIKSIEGLYANDENKDDLLKEQWELFNQKPDFEKRKELQTITNDLLKEQQEKISKFTPQQAAQPQVDPKEVERHNMATQELNSYLDSIVKTEVNGIKMTPVRVSKINDVVMELPTQLFTDETGKLDMKKAVDIANYALYGDVMISKAKRDAKTEGKVEILADKHNQSANNAHNLPLGGEKADALKEAGQIFLNS